MHFTLTEIFLEYNLMLLYHNKTLPTNFFWTDNWNTELTSRMVPKVQHFCEGNRSSTKTICVRLSAPRFTQTRDSSTRLNDWLPLNKNQFHRQAHLTIQTSIIKIFSSSKFIKNQHTTIIITYLLLASLLVIL